MGGGTFKVTKLDGTQIITGSYDSGDKVKEVKTKTMNEKKMKKNPDIKTWQDVLDFVSGQAQSVGSTMKNVAVGYTGNWRTDSGLEDKKMYYKKMFKESGIQEDWILDVSNADEAKYMGLLMNEFIEGHTKGTFKTKVCCEVSSTTGQFCFFNNTQAIVDTLHESGSSNDKYYEMLDGSTMGRMARLSYTDVDEKVTETQEAAITPGQTAISEDTRPPGLSDALEADIN